MFRIFGFLQDIYSSEIETELLFSKRTLVLTRNPIYQKDETIRIPNLRAEWKSFKLKKKSLKSFNIFGSYKIENI